jgi:hypothetical protein
MSIHICFLSVGSFCELCCLEANDVSGNDKGNVGRKILKNKLTVLKNEGLRVTNYRNMYYVMKIRCKCKCKCKCKLHAFICLVS